MKKLFAEMIRRKVLQSVGAYVLACLFILEAADLILPSMAVPESVYDMLVAFLLLMLPIVFVLSWYFDLTKGGVVRTGDDRSSAYSRSSVFAPGNHNPTAAGALRDFVSPLAPLVEAHALAAAGSVAILPFTNKSDDRDGEYLSDGITETIINKLASLKNLRVIPRASAFRYKASDLDITRISQELGVRSVVTGSVTHVGERLIVQAELVDIQRQSQVWGERFNERWEDLFEMQERIATEISKSLKPELSNAERESIEKRDTEHLTAYQDYLRGRFHWNKRTAEGMEAAAEYFRSAIDHDPLYALAYSGLADTYNIMGYYSLVAPNQSYPLAIVADQTALKLEPDLAEAYASLGYSTLFYDRDWEAARGNFEKSIDLDPQYGTAHQWHAWYFLVLGRFDEALDAFKRAAVLDPVSLVINDHLAYGYMLVDDMENARQQIERTRLLNPTYPLALWRLGEFHLRQEQYDEAVSAYSEAESLTDGRLTLGYLGLTYGLMDREVDARSILARLDDYEDQRYVSPLDRALVHAGLKDADNVFRFIEKAIDIRVSDAIRLALLPWPDPIKSDPRFAAAVATLNLPE